MTDNTFTFALDISHSRWGSWQTRIEDCCTVESPRDYYNFRGDNSLKIIKNTLLGCIRNPAYYIKSEGAAKKKIPGCIFAEKLVLENGPPSLKLRRIKGELQPVHSKNPYNSSSMPVSFREVPIKNKR
jgi:hypothetical protein